MAHIVASAVALLSCLTLTQARSVIKQDLKPCPNSHIIEKFEGWLSAVNTADEDIILDFYTSSSTITNCETVDGLTCHTGCKCESMPRYITWQANWTGGYELIDAEYGAGPSLTALLQTKNDLSYTHTRYYEASMVIDEEAPGKPITRLDLFSVTRPLSVIPTDDPRRGLLEKGLQPLTAGLKEKLVREMMLVLRKEYINARRGEELAVMLYKNLESGVYESITDSNEFSRRLQADLIDDSYDDRSGHKLQDVVGISFREPHWPRSEELEEVDMRSDSEAHRHEYYEESGYGFHNISFDVEAIPGKTIATLSIRQLLPLDDADVLEVVTTKLNSVADADVLILDLRNSFSGPPETAAFILSYFFETKMTLALWKDRNDVVQHIISTLPRSNLPTGAKIYGDKKPIYVLTNNRTFSAAELLASPLQGYGRAIVIGENEATRGWVCPHETLVGLCEEDFGKEWWTLYVPSLKLEHAATGATEGMGVRSDIVVEEEDYCGRKARDAAIAFERHKERRPAEVQDELR